LALIVVQAVYPFNNIIKIDFLQVLTELLNLVLRERVKELVFIQVYYLASCQAADSAPSLYPEEHLLIAEECTSLDLSQTVLKAP
jgi:hypothetical protein